MSNLLLDLPRELRDKIYNYVLVSETGFVEPTELPRPQNTSSSSPRFYLLVQDPRDASIHGDRLPAQETKLQKAIITLSLLRTNRQIYHETYHLFWHSNTFYFQTASDLGWTLKAMGQTPSRLIQSANLAIMHRCAPHQVKPIAKAFRLLASRARHGSFKRLQLTVSQHLIEFMGKFLRDSTIPKLNREYDEFLKVLRDGSDGCKYERTIHADMFQPTIPLNMTEDWEKSVARDIHFAWGGKFYWGGLLLWEDFIEVGEETSPKQLPATDEVARKPTVCLEGMASTT